MNRRLLSSTLSLSALVAITSLAAATPAVHAAGPVVRTRVLIAPFVTQSGDPDAELAAGIAAYNAGNFDSAITHFQTALKLRAKFADAAYNLGLAYEAKKDYKSAIAAFTKVITEKPKLSDAYVERGRCYAASGDFDDAMKDFSGALTLKPNLSDAYLARADAYFQMKKYDLAVADYQKYLTLEPKPDTLIYYNLGAVNYAAGHYDAAIEAFKKFAALATPDQLADTYSFIGDAYTAKKDYASAIPAYTKYITAHPEDKTGLALKGRGLAYLQSKQNAEAAADYKKYLVLQPNDKEAQNNLIVALSGDKNVSPTALIQQLTDAIAKDPSNMALRTTLAAKQMEVKDYAAAIVQYNAIIAAKPDDSAALYNRGVAYGLQKDTVKAAADFAAYTKMKPADPAGWNNLGVFLGQNKDYKGSIAAFTQYISLKPTDPEFIEAYKNRGIAYFNLQDWKNAQADLTQYNTAKPGDKDVPNLLAQAIQNGGGDAIPALLAVVKAPPGITDPNAWFNLGVAYLGKKDNENAAMAFSKSNALKPDPQTLFNRSLAYYNLGMAGNAAAYAKAEADAGAALAMKPDYSDALLVKADSEYAEKKADLASADYGKYAAMPGVSAENKLYASKRMLQSYIDNKNFSGVITATNALIQSNPAEPQNYFIRGTAYDAMKNFDMAIPDLVKYTGMKPDDAMGFFNLASAYAGKMDNVNAAPMFEKAATLKPDMYDAASAGAGAYKKLADGDQADSAKATAEYDKAIALYDKASGITTATPKQQADALYNEAAALEAKAKALDNIDPLKIAIVVWGKWAGMSPTDPELPKIKQHIIDLQTKVAKES